MTTQTVKVNEIFRSISGEVGLFRQGSFTAFIRLDGCNLRCSYCDTPKTQEGNAHKEYLIKDVVNEVRRLHCPQVIITGGEPLLQREALDELCVSLKNRGYVIQIETNGSVNPNTVFLQSAVDCWVVDYKLPSSGQQRTMMTVEEYAGLPPESWVKFVIGTAGDFREATKIYNSLSTRTSSHLNYAMSPTDPKTAHVLYSWMTIHKDLRDVILNVQIHKLVNLL